MTLLEVRCPDCNRVLMKADPSALPELRQAERLRARKTRLGALRSRQEDHADRQEARGLARFRAAWARVAAENLGCYCVPCDAWAELAPDPSAPHGLRSRRHAKKDKKARVAGASDPPATEHHGGRP